MLLLFFLSKSDEETLLRLTLTGGRRLHILKLFFELSQVTVNSHELLLKVCF